MRKLAVVFLVAGVVMVGVFRFAGWRAETALLPRFCEDPAGTIAIVRAILRDPDPTHGQKHRPYIIAAKLIFLVPQHPDEPETAYLDRLRGRIDESCRQAY